MKCSICDKEIDHVCFEVIPACAIGTGIVKIKTTGEELGEIIAVECDPTDLTAPDPDPTFKCPECHGDITDSIENADDFWELC